MKERNYKQAAENFRKAHEVYLPLGNYKDSAKQADIYEKNGALLRQKTSISRHRLLCVKQNI